MGVGLVQVQLVEMGALVGLGRCQVSLVDPQRGGERQVSQVVPRHAAHGSAGGSQHQRLGQVPVTGYRIGVGLGEQLDRHVVRAGVQVR